MDDLDRLVQIARSLTSAQLRVLITMALSVGRALQITTNPQSDLLDEQFVAAFSATILAHHATNAAKMSKKTFEYAFVLAAREAGRDATISSNSTNPGADATVDGIAFSLKTEASRNIKVDRIMISKLMEARWIRDCTTPADFARGVQTYIINHLQRYQRIVMLRAFDLRDGGVRYDLVEIPTGLLLEVGHLTSADFEMDKRSGGGTVKRKSGGSRAEVTVGGKRGFDLGLDGSVEKVQVLNLAVDLCIIHGSWSIPATGNIF